MLKQLVEVALLVYAVSRIYELAQGRKRYSSNVPRIYTSVQPMSLWSAFLPNTPFHRRLGDHWDRRLSLYKDAPLNTLVIQPWLGGQGFLYTRNLASFTQALALGADYIKGRNAPLEMLGVNVVVAEGDTWKRHRRITAPAFNHTTYKNVWETTVRVYNEMIGSEGWMEVNETPVVDFNKITHKLALFLISIVGFGLPMTWNEQPRNKNGNLSTQAMIFDMASYLWTRWALPRWAYGFGNETISRIDDAYNAFVPFMKERITERKIELEKLRATSGRSDFERQELIKDVFGRLVDATLSEGKLALSDEELIGNSFVFIFAGHETTANTLAVTLALLALYPDAQEWVYNEIKTKLGDREPTFDDFDDLMGVLACFYEGARLFPAAYFLARIPTKNVVLRLPTNSDMSAEELVTVEKGALILLDMVGMCYDPASFPDPMSYNPRRWTSSRTTNHTPTTEAQQADEMTGNSPASTFEGFMGFSWGPRTCLGHKFAKVEAVAFLTMILRAWKVEVELHGESEEAWRERMLAPKFRGALLVGEVPLKLSRRIA